MRRVTSATVTYDDGTSETWVGPGSRMVQRTFLPAQKKKDEKPSSFVTVTVDFTETDADRERIDAARASV
jgi:hypothetical protein